MLLLKHLSGELPDFVYGLGFGTAIAFLLIGGHAEKPVMSKIHAYKMNFLKKCFNR